MDGSSASLAIVPSVYAADSSFYYYCPGPQSFNRLNLPLMQLQDTIQDALDEVGPHHPIS